MPTSIHTLPNELLISIFGRSIANSDSVHTRATLALVSRYWKDVIYSTPALWTTLRTSVWGYRALLGLTNSQEMPLDVDMTVRSVYDHRPKEALEKICKQLHRWRSATLRIPFDRRLMKSFHPKAPLLEYLSIEPTDSQRQFLFNPFQKHAPKLRSISLNRVEVPWNNGILSGLEALELKNISDGPTGVQITSILKLSPRLSSLKLHNVHSLIPRFAATTSHINLPRLQVLEIEEVDTALVAHLLSRIKSSSCSVIRVHCNVDVGEARLFKASSAVIPNVLPDDSRVEITLERDIIRYSLRGSPNQRISIWLEDDRTYNLLDRLIHDGIPSAFLALDIKLTLHVGGYTGERERGWTETSDEMHVTSLSISGAVDGILNRLTTPSGGRWLFPYLQAVIIAIGDVDPGTVARMVKARHGFDGSELPLPMPFTSVTITDALSAHALDLAVIESVIGSEGLTWGMMEGELEETEE